MKLPSDFEGEKVSLFKNEDIKTQTLNTGISDGLFLGVYQEKKKISILHTISRKMTIPVCSKCTTRPCPCFKHFKNNETEGTDDDETAPWKREENKKAPTEHFENPVTLQERYKEYGCNKTKIIYPIRRDPVRLEAWVQRTHGREPEFPEEKLIPDFEEELMCKHENTFLSSEAELVKISDTVTVFNEQSEKVYNIKLYGRRTGLCQCLQQVREAIIKPL